MRLRPSGNKGPVAVRLSTFERYHMTERLDLGAHGADPGPRGRRARRRCGADRGRAAARRHHPAGAAETALADAVAMRARMLRDLPPEGPWDLKAMPGGLIEVEFIAQALQLRHAAENPKVLATYHAAGAGPAARRRGAAGGGGAMR